MSRTRMLFILSGLWLFAIVAPSVITLLNGDKTSVVSNLNEEEPHEQGKKGADEKSLTDHGTSTFFLTSRLENCSGYSFYLEISLDNTLEIVLPPPEYS